MVIQSKQELAELDKKMNRRRKEAFNRTPVCVDDGENKKLEEYENGRKNNRDCE